MLLAAPSAVKIRAHQGSRRGKMLRSEQAKLTQLGGVKTSTRLYNQAENKSDLTDN